MVKLLLSGIVMMLLVSGCGWNGTPTREDDFTPLTSITISAVSPTIAASTSTRLIATGHYSGLGTQDITDKVTWSSDAPSVAAFNSAVIPGRVTGVAAGNAGVTATLGALSATYTVTVSSATISSIAVTPATPTVAKGKIQQFKATGTFSDATTQDITSDVAWTSTATDVATISAEEISNGLATAVAASGSSTITATFGGVTGTALMTATLPLVTSIEVTPANPTVLSLSTKSFTATGTYSDGSTAVITSGVTWSSNNTGCATMSSGVATALATGSTTIRATVGSVSGSTGLTVTGGSLNSIAVAASAPTLANGTRTRITATGTFSDGATRDITGAVTWTPASTSLATVTASGGNLAWLNAVGVTPGTIITATGVSTTTKTGTVTLAVTSPALSSLAMSSSILAVTVGTSAPLAATATYNSSPGNQDVTYDSGCSWSSSDTSVVTVGTDGLVRGRVTGVAAGTATITATFGGKSVTSTVTVSSRTLSSLTLSGLTSVTPGYQTSYTATATYVDGTALDVTNNTKWSLSSTTVAALADEINQPGQIVAVTSGSTILSAEFGGKTTTMTINVP